tara:strand:+ start:16905 stop:18035 length:1131 start_codon:yes stop_codon:yes gene_type:complete
MAINYDGVQPSRLGSNQLGANEDLFLKVFSGEVLTVFEENNAMMPLHRVRTIKSGKTAQFPVTGVAEAKYHTPGESLFTQEFDDASDTTGTNKYLSRVTHSEKTIAIDGVLTSSAFLADIDEAKNHYEVRSVYSTEIGRQLAYTADRNLIRTVIAGARDMSDRFGGTNGDGISQFGGAVVNMGTTVDNSVNEVHIGTTDQVNDGAAATGASLIAGLFKAAEVMDSKNVPSEGRYSLLPPAEYYKLINESKDAINRDYGNDGNGSTASGEIVSVAGIRILKSNHIPTSGGGGTNIHSNANVSNDIYGSGGVGYEATSYAETKGIVFQTEGVGTVKLMDLSMESEYYMERLGTLLMARYAMGHGVLREEACCELIVTA